MASLNLSFSPSSPDLDWHDYFAEYGAAVAAAKALRDGDTLEGEDDIEEAPAFTVIDVTPNLGPADLGTAAKAVYLAATALGWEVRAWRTRTHHDAVLFKETSESHNAGDVRTAAHERRHYRVEAKDARARLGFSAVFMGKDDPRIAWEWENRHYWSALWWPKGFPKNPADNKTAGFVNVLVYDPIGLPVENYNDYSPTSEQIKRLGRKTALERADRLDREYNDGSSRLETEALLRSSTPFNAWLDDWLGMLAPDHKKLSRAPKKAVPTKTEKFEGELALLLDTGEWSAE